MSTPAAPTTERRLGHLPGLDGLRGVAVLLVLLYHLDITGFDGGFVGVDMFFVLSGFLITSLLLAEQHAHRGVDLVAFWLRRARRLLPAVLVVLAVVVLLAPTIDASLRGSLRWDAITSIFYVVNWRFVLTGASYAAENSDPSMLGHLWSLAIEEQFYVLWPLIIAIGAHLVRGRHDARRLGLIAMGTAAAGSAVLLAAGYDRFDPSGAYFATQTRVFEPLFGAFLALAISPRQYRSQRATGRATLTADALVVACIAAIAWCATQLDFRDIRYYRGGAIAISLATCLLVVTIVERNRLTSLVLDLAPLRLCGRVSYGIYLWHWPVIVWLDADRTGWTGGGLLAARLAVIAALTAVSYVCIESPIRSGRVRGVVLGPRIAFPAFGATALVVVALTFVGTSGAEPVPEYLSEDGGVRDTDGDAPADAQVYAIVGDSVARSLAPGLEAEATKRDLGYAQATFGGCSVGQLLRLDENDDPFSNAARCVEETRAAFDALVAHSDPDVVLWYSQRERYAVEVDGEALAAGTREWATAVFADWDGTLDRLTASGARLALVLPAYGNGGHTELCEGDDPYALLEREECRADNGALTGGPLRAFYRVWAAGHGDRVVVVDATPIVCSGEDPCPAEAGGVALRPDDGIHFSEAGAAWVAPRLLDAVDTALAASP